MKIRSITCFSNPNNEEFSKQIQSLNDLQRYCREEFENIGWEVQTTRLATTSFGTYTNQKNALLKITELEHTSIQNGFSYLSIGPARISYLDEYALIPEILAATQNVFCSGIMTHPQRGISVPAVKACAEVIKHSAGIQPDGFANLRFCAISHVSPFTPFFPASYSYGTQPAFALAMQCADAALEAFDKVENAKQGCLRLLNALNNAANALLPILKTAEKKFGIPFKGFDFSLAPFPEDWCSIGRTLEKMGIASLGYMGSLTASALLTDTLDRGSWWHVGFNGLMLPVLEDSTLAARSENSTFTIKDLVMYSAVCGTGLDTVPLPGDISIEKITALLMDISALSLRLRKPLTARLMPIPGLQSGQRTQFDFGFFCNGNVMDFPAAALGVLLSNSQWLEIRKREKFT